MDVTSPRPGLRIGRWRLRRRLGQGAFGSTWAAEDEDGRLAAIKTLEEPPGEELKALSRIYHPCVVDVFGGGGEPIPHLVMEYVRGRCLSDYLRAGAAPEQKAVAITALLADALATVHQAGVVHGDLKPDNVMVESIEIPKVKLVDFGMAGTALGGTVAYAPPERLRGGESSPAADLYTLGLLLWEMLHGHRPWEHLDLSATLARRQHEIPSVERGEPWLRELLRSLLATEPRHRPPAGQVADTLLQHGAHLPTPDVGTLRRRARRVLIQQDAVRETLDRWRKQGGVLGLFGPSGSGRSHQLDGLATEFEATGQPWIRVQSSPHPWEPVEQLLASPSLPAPAEPLPDIPEPSARANAAARALLRRAPEKLFVLVDDLHHAEEPTRLTVQALARLEGTSICITAPRDPGWVRHRCPLPTFEDEEIEALARRILGPLGNPAPLVKACRDASGGLPGQAVAFLLFCVQEGALVWRARRWIADPDRLALLREGEEAPRVRMEGNLGPSAQKLGAWLAIHELPVPVSILPARVQMNAATTHEALRELEDTHFIRLESGMAACRSDAARRTLAGLCDDPRPIHRQIASRLLEEPDASPLRLGRHLVGAEDADRAKALGPELLSAATALHPAEAARLAEDLWALVPGSAMVIPRLRALIAAGQSEEALAFAESMVSELTGPGERATLHGLQARIHGWFTGDTDRAMACIEEARRALGGASLPPELVEIEAQVCFRAQRYEEAIRAAKPLADTVPPQEPEALDRWMALRMVWAQSLHAVEDTKTAVTLLEQVPPPLGRGRPARAMLDASLGLLLWHAKRHREALEVMSRAAQEDSGLSPLERARQYNNMGIGHYSMGDRSRALERWEEALVLFERLDVPLEQVRVKVNLCVGYREMGRWKRAARAGKWALNKALELGDHEHAAQAAGNVGDLKLAQERYLEADQWFRKTEEIADAHDLRGEKIELARRRAELALRRRESNALDLAEKALAVADASDEISEAARARALMAVSYARIGRYREMEAKIQSAIRPLEEAGASGELAEVRIWAAEAYLTAGKAMEALEQATRTLVFADEMDHVQLHGRAAELVKRIRVIQGQDRRSVRLERLQALAVAVARERDLTRLLEAVAEAALDLLDFERSFVLLEEGGAVDVAASSIRQGTEQAPPSRTIVEPVIRAGKETVIWNVDERGTLRSTPTIRDLAIRSAMCMPMLEGDRILGAIYVDSRQVTEEELIEAANLLRALASHAAVAVTNARHLEEVGERAANGAKVAHDLKSPTNTITGAIQRVLGNTDLADPDREILNHALEAAGKIRAWSRNFLEDHAAVHRAVNLSDLVEREIAQTTLDPSFSRIRLETQVDPDVLVHGDVHALTRILGNLLSNAAKYSPDGGTVHVHLREDEDEVRLVVQDEGRGIAPEQLQRIFDRGYQAPGAEKGTGLGLNTARSFVRDHGGRIEADNAPEGGARFTVHLPRTKESQR